MERGEGEWYSGEQSKKEWERRSIGNLMENDSG
jgi:hypothetical protein